jgi:hypothetical protein
MLAGTVDFVIGVDTHRDNHTAVTVTPARAVHADLTVPADPGGYCRPLRFAEQSAPGRRRTSTSIEASLIASAAARAHGRSDRRQPHRLDTADRARRRGAASARRGRPSPHATRPGHRRPRVRPPTAPPRGCADAGSAARSTAGRPRTAPVSAACAPGHRAHHRSGPRLRSDPRPPRPPPRDPRSRPRHRLLPHLLQKTPRFLPPASPPGSIVIRPTRPPGSGSPVRCAR